MSFLKEYWDKVPEEKRKEEAIAYLASLDVVHKAYPEVARALVQELKDQRSHLKLIASENYCSLSVQLAMGNLLTDKYSEGSIKKRFYAGCENVDRIEEEAVFYAKKIFAAEHAYVQPHSGSDANLIALWSILLYKLQNPFLEKLGKKNIGELSFEEHEALRQILINQKVLGMSLNSGGHLTHGYRQNISSKLVQAYGYEVDAVTGLLDYEALRKRAKQVKPLILLAGYSAYSRLIDFSKMREIADEIGAVLWVDMAHFAGLVAGKVLQGVYDPIPYAHMVTTTTHKVLRGPRGGLILCKKEFKELVDKGCPWIMGGPMPHIMAAKALSFKEADTPAYRLYAHQVVKNSQALAEALMEEGVEVLTQGTENHLVLINVLKSFALTGRQAEVALKKAGIHVNRNALFNDEKGPWYTSGIRIGTPAVTTLAMKEEQMRKIAQILVFVLKNGKTSSKEQDPSKAQVLIEEKVLNVAREKVEDLLDKHPLYPELILEEKVCSTK